MSEIQTTEKIDIKKELLELAISTLNNNINPTSQVENLLNYAAIDHKFATITRSQNKRVISELKTQFKFINELGLDIAKGKKLVYIKTRGVNIALQGQPKNWLTMPDIQISYHALILILVRSKAIKSVDVFHTYEKYPIEFSGIPSDVPVVKSWEVRANDRGEYTGCFVVLKNIENEISTSFHHYADIVNTHKQFSKSLSTWNNHTQAMTAKSAILDAIRYIPKLDEDLQKVVEVYDENQDYSKSEKINKKQIKELSEMSDTLNIDLITLFEYLKCDKWEEINSTQYQETVVFMNSVKNKIEEKKDEN
jgi:recombinational DNA repair protein RecT